MTTFYWAASLLDLFYSIKGSFPWKITWWWMLLQLKQLLVNFLLNNLLIYHVVNQYWCGFNKNVVSFPFFVVCLIDSKENCKKAQLHSITEGTCPLQAPRWATATGQTGKRLISDTIKTTAYEHQHMLLFPIMKPRMIRIKGSSAIHKAASAIWLAASTLALPPFLSLSLPLSLSSLAPAILLKRGNYCMALSDLNEADMKGLTEMKPGS